MAYQNSPRIITDGLVLCLDAGNIKSYGGSGATWYDLTKNNNTATLVGSPTFSSTNNGCIVFNGTSNYATITSSPTFNPSTQITVSLWYNSTFLPTGQFYTYCLMSSQQSTSPYNGIDIRGSSASTINFAIAINSVSTLVDLGNITANQWIFVTATYNGSALIGYRNGVQVQSVSTTGTINSSNTNLWIGNNPSFGPRYYTGKISIAQIYNKALSPSEVLQNYNATKTRFGL